MYLNEQVLLLFSLPKKYYCCVRRLNIKIFQLRLNLSSNVSIYAEVKKCWKKDKRRYIPYKDDQLKCFMHFFKI